VTDRYWMRSTPDCRLNNGAPGAIGGVIVSVALDPYLTLRKLAEYSGIARRTLRQYLDLPPQDALPCYRLPGKILVRVSEFDAWLTAYRSRGRPNVARALAEMGLLQPS
jgi:hypothetical protein